MVARFLIAVLVALGIQAGLAAPPAELPPPSSKQIEFTSDIAPLLESRCLVCHGPQVQMNGLRLDLREDALRGSLNGPVIQPGQSADSKLIQIVAGLVEGKIMPPAGERLSNEQIGLLRAWIDQGANWPETIDVTQGRERGKSHWAFQPVQRPTIPQVRSHEWLSGGTGSSNEIDRFMLAKLQAEGVEPSPQADAITLARRLHLDLTGLPPTPEQLAAFASDSSSNAYGNLVDRLLDSPHYGEKWGRHWLDLARYGDSNGFRGDKFREHAWRYRHWVINAFNSDMPFDQFTIEQIAGDLLPGRTTEQWVATGFHRNTPTNTEGGSEPEEWRFEQVVNRTNTLGTVWLGLTAGCAQCHNHKYDPITQKEYYQLFAFFNDAEEVNIDAPLDGERGPYMRALPAYQKERDRLLAELKVKELKAAWEKKVRYHAAHEGESNAWDGAFDELRTFVDLGETILFTPPELRSWRREKRITDFFVSDYHRVLGKEEWKELGFIELKKKLRELDETLPPFSGAQVIHVERNPRKSHVFLGGSYKTPGIEIEKATPSWLHPLKAVGKPTRLDLGQWLVSPENPLTSRVMVNRIWQELFGSGLVTTSEDLGSQGEKPSHPELLDWLASEFMGTWSYKQTIKTIVMSAAYRQSSKARPELSEHDPENRLVARQGRFRLPAELIRDSALAVSGLLYPKVGGRSVRPPQPEGANRMGAGSDRWKVSEGPDRYRRGLYIQHQRMAPYPLLTNFDMPAGYVASCRRDRSNSPLQALNLLNDPVFIESAQALAARTLTEAPGGVAERLNYAFELCVGRQPEPVETDWLQTSFEEQKRILAQDSEQAQKLFPLKLASVSPEEGAAWVGVSSVLLNLDEFITRE